jgi:hypothetical protein
MITLTRSSKKKITGLSVLLLLAGGLTWSWREAASQNQFSRQIWAASSLSRLGNNPDNPRMRMANNVLKNHLRAGMSRNEVISLLGAPDEPTDRDDQAIWYYLGGYSGGSFLRGSDYLVIEFDERGKLAAKRIQKSG